MLLRRAVAAVVLLLAVGVLSAQNNAPVGTIFDLRQLRDRTRLYLDYPRGTTYQQLGLTGKGGKVQVAAYTAPSVVNCAGTSSGWAPVAGSAGEWSACSAGTQTRTESRTFTITQNPANGGTACPSSPQLRTVSQSCTAPQPGADPIWGTPPTGASLGTCSLATHDAYVVSGGDGWRYRTWHPQQDPSGCVYGHEHGDNPARMTDSQIRALPIRFGYISRRHPMPPLEPDGHDEPHEGYKVFVALPGDVNDEGRRNRVFSRSVFHMGTAGPARFGMQMHSADVAVRHPEFSLYAHTQLMMDTGGVDVVCDPRVAAPVKDVISLQSRCKISSLYEIWSTIGVVEYQGREVYRSFVTPAVFDPITVFNPANPTEVVYAWDSRMTAILAFPNDLPRFQSNRGCDRESYAQPGYWYNAGQYATGRTTFYTDPMGQETTANAADVLVQTISQSHSIGSPATNDGLVAYKQRVDYCGGALKARLGLKN
jgi:hypothetical protein